ncbi:glutamate receptor 2.7 [Ziziphus jujuba]|uniref:Glutamate receptor 2.7 n=1 Tax=Ziziphus jujuba TaxID=326968 RepID=A0A6P4A1P1_ZIZJJ|nr:glutamate receptor 2.7 [Ziziphus jujuba]
MTTYTDDNVVEELYKLMDFQTKVFLVHMSKAPMSKLLINVKRLGMMSEGYASFVTASTMNLLSSIDSYVIGSMQGLVGSKSNIPATKDLQNLALRLRRKFSIELSVYGIWAYDSIWALAEAVERARDYNKLVSSIKNGSLLVEEILRSRFFGLSVFSGFCIEAFMLAIRKLPYPVEVEFIPNGGTYNDLVYQNFGGAMGDISITWERSLYADFTISHTNSSSIAMVVPNQSSKRNMWIFLSPLAADLWITTTGFFILTGFKLYSSPEEYAEALSKGSKHGGVSAIVDEAPYIKRFVAKYPSDYTLKTMPMSNISGFGYVLRKYLFNKVSVVFVTLNY